MKNIPGATESPCNCGCADCLTCGALDCVERPRFYCGQLLTDGDLDAAQHYVIEKNRLHNRHLVGTGVACGLAVRCDPCSPGGVVVEPGYAIDCCGNDVVVCAPAPFDVAGYLAACFRPPDPCKSPLAPPAPSICDGQVTEYCLILSYAEQPFRPQTTFLRGDRCSPTACEPSRIRETYRLDLIKKADRPKDPPSMWDKLAACLTPGVKALTDFGQKLNAAGALLPKPRYDALLAAFCDMKAYLNGVRSSRCNLRDEVADLEKAFPTFNPQDKNYEPALYHSLMGLFGWTVRSLIDCLCDALLVPCAPCGEPEGVLLACLTVVNGKVRRICNLERRQLITGPALHYWAQPLFTVLGDLIERLCCTFEPASVFAENLSLKGQGVGFAHVAQAHATSALKMAQTYGGNFLSGFDAKKVTALTDPKTLTAMDLVGLKVKDANALLKTSGVRVQKTPTSSKAAALSLSNLLSMSWIIPTGSLVELTVNGDDGTVTAVRTAGGNQ